MTQDQVAKIIDYLACANVLELSGLIRYATERLGLLQDLHETARMREEPTPAATYQTTQHRVLRVYAAGAPGLLSLCRDLGRRQVHKIGTTRQKDLLLRLGDLSRDHYGAFDARRNVVQPGFGGYVQIPFGLSADIALPPSVRHRDGCFEVDLPPSLTYSGFEAAFRRALRPLTLISWASSVEGRAQLEASGLAEADLPQATRLAGRAVKAEEFYVIQPRRQAALVLAAIVAALGS